MIFPSFTKTDPIGIPPSDSPFWASSMAADKNSSVMVYSYLFVFVSTLIFSRLGKFNKPIKVDQNYKRIGKLLFRTDAK
jgi:hypothetical protein